MMQAIYRRVVRTLRYQNDGVQHRLQVAARRQKLIHFCERKLGET